MPPAVIAGMSLISPAGRTADETFQACLEGRCAGRKSKYDPPLDRVPLAQLPPIPELDALCKTVPERSAALGVLAAREALADAGLEPEWMCRAQSAVVVGTSKAGVLTALAAADDARQGRSTGGLWQWGTPAGAAEAISAELRPGGEVQSVTAACATALAAIARGADLIAAGRADTVLVVATDATIHPLFFGNFHQMGVLARWRDVPGDACRPFAADRCGFVLGEGAGAVVLRPPYAKSENSDSPAVAVVGSASGNQAADLVKPADSCDAMASLFGLAVKRAGWSDVPIDLVHAHGTGTIAGDLAETRAIRQAMGDAADDAVVISTKPVTGHMLGAAGMVQAVVTAKAMAQGVVPPTANLEYADPLCDLDYNATGPRELRVRRAVCMASGFGGSTAAVAMEMLGPGQE